MKRSLFIAIVVLLMATLFVSCNAEKSLEDQLFEVTIDGNSRALQATGEFNVDINTFYWFYTATKTSGGFRTGEKTVETPVNADGSAGIVGASLGSFSKGTWEFCFYGYAKLSHQGTAAKRIYFQTGLRQTISSAVSLAITLERGQGALPAATVEFNNPTWYHEDFKILPANQTEGYALDLKVFVGDETEAWRTVRATTVDGKATFEFANTDILTLEEATTLLFRVYWGDDLVGSTNLEIPAAGATRYIVSDLTGTESGIQTVDNRYGVVIFDASVPDLAAGEATGSIIVSKTDPTIVTANVAPVEAHQTTVSFPAGSFSSEVPEEHELTIAVDDAAAAAATTFVVQDTSVDVSGTPIAVLSFNLSDAPTTFGDYVEVVTYIQTGLDPDSIKVVYNGDDGKEQPQNVTYTANDGKLTFKTKHFSDYVVVYTKAVARIGNSLYETFDAAFAAVQDGETLVLLKNTEGSIDLHNGGTVTIDINGTTFTGGNMWITDDSTLIVDGSKAGSKVLGCFCVGYSTPNNNNGNLVINGGTYQCPENDTCLHINGTCLDSDVTIRNATIISPNDNGIQLNGSGTFLIENSTITGATAIYVKSGNLTINGGTYTGNMAPANYSYYGNGANATGDAIVIDSCEYPGGAPTVTIKNGTFTGTKSSIGYYRYDANSDGEFQDAAIIVEEGTFDVATPVAIISNRAGLFTSLADAVTEAQNGDVIVMIGDTVIPGNAGITIPAGKTITLDLAGHTVKNAVNENASSQVFLNKGTLTIKDSSDLNKDGTGNGVLTNGVLEGTEPGEWWSDPQRNYATNVISNSGTLTIESGKIAQTAVGSICYAVDNNSTAGNAILNVKGGMITGVGTVVRMFCNSTENANTLNITGGAIATDTGYTAFWIQLPGSNAQSMKNAALNISGGLVAGATYAFYDYSYGDGWENVSYSITGGTFDGYIYSYKANNKFIAGGIFTADPTDYVLSGHSVVENANGTYSVN